MNTGLRGADGAPGGRRVGPVAAYCPDMPPASPDVRGGSQTRDTRSPSNSSTASNTWDVIVIGGGPAGENAADYAIRGSDRTAVIVENELVGGECSYWACIPSKTLLRSVEVFGEAEVLQGTRNPAQYQGDRRQGGPRPPGRLHLPPRRRRPGEVGQGGRHRRAARPRPAHRDPHGPGGRLRRTGPRHHGAPRRRRRHGHHRDDPGHPRPAAGAAVDLARRHEPPPGPAPGGDPRRRRCRLRGGDLAARPGRRTADAHRRRRPPARAGRAVRRRARPPVADRQRRQGLHGHQGSRGDPEVPAGQRDRPHQRRSGHAAHRPSALHRRRRAGRRHRSHPRHAGPRARGGRHRRRRGPGARVHPHQRPAPGRRRERPLAVCGR